MFLLSRKKLQEGWKLNLKTTSSPILSQRETKHARKHTRAKIVGVGVRKHTKFGCLGLGIIRMYRTLHRGQFFQFRYNEYWVKITFEQALVISCELQRDIENYKYG